MEDLKGMKIRSTGIAAKVVTALGGTPVAMPIFEAYDALSRGVVDSMLSSLETLESFKLAEVTKFTTESTSAGSIGIICAAMNTGKWNVIPPDAQKVIEEVSRGWGEKTAKSLDETEDSARAFSLKFEHKFLRLSEEEEQRWAKAVEPLFDEYVKEKKAKGLPAEEVLKFCRERLKQLQ
jgi:TRAP-type C4-dicarboxylate transport system substrate-binding protein